MPFLNSSPKEMKKLLLLACGLLLLAACNVELKPIEAGFTADTWVTADGPFKTELSSAQLKAIAEWFDAHRTGWKEKITDSPPGPMILLKHRGGRTTSVYLRGNEVWVKNRYLVLTPKEYSDLQAILAPKN
jgi:hypothetical protein